MKHKNFFIVPNQIFELGLKPKEFTVYCCLLRHSDKNTDNCFPSRRLIADECSMDKKTVDSALKELEARGLIKKVCRYRENGSRTSNLYYLASLLEYSLNGVEYLSVENYNINFRNNRIWVTVFLLLIDIFIISCYAVYIIYHRTSKDPAFKIKLKEKIESG